MLNGSQLAYQAPISIKMAIQKYNISTWRAIKDIISKNRVQNRMYSLTIFYKIQYMYMYIHWGEIAGKKSTKVVRCLLLGRKIIDDFYLSVSSIVSKTNRNFLYNKFLKIVFNLLLQKIFSYSLMWLQHPTAVFPKAWNVKCF